MNQSTQTNRRIRVFVSSTFQDMREEREALMSHTWTALRSFCRERQVELVEVDLRWGILEAQSTRKDTLTLCLNEIRACRPFFIGLLGERYGWVPGDEAMTADLLEEEPWLQRHRQKSVTELEILHGVLNNPEMAGRAFFYFRDPAYAHSHGTDFLPENPVASVQQATLKNDIRTACASKGIPLREHYPDPIQLSKRVLDDLRAAIDADYPKESIPDPLTREAKDHEAFAEVRRRTYIDRPDYYHTLDRHVASNGGPLVLLGESGGGKSALLANWATQWRKNHPQDFLVEHYIGGTPDSADHWRVMQRLIAEIARWTGDAEALPKSHEDLLKTFPIWVAKARSKAEHDGVHCMLILDSLNQLEDQDRARLLGWLPAHAFAGPLRLIASTLQGETLQAVEARGWASLSVEPLTSDERRRMIEAYLERCSKKLDPPRVERLMSAPAAANPLYLKILLDELRVTGTHERLDERLQTYLAAPDIPALLKVVLARYQRDYERDRPGLVRDALGLIWAARRGLTETELLQLLKPPDQPQLPAAIWAPLRAALEEGLVDRGGLLNCAHAFLRTAVETAFVADEDTRDDIRLQLAGYFETQPVSARNCDELPWLLWHTESCSRLRACLLDIDRFHKIHQRDEDELMRYWVWLGEARTMGKSYLASFDLWAKESGCEDTLISVYAGSLGYFLESAALYTDAEPLIRRALAFDEQSLGVDYPRVAINLNNLAMLLKATNRLTEAEPLMYRALAIVERNLGPDHPTVAIGLNNLALLLQATNRLTEAEPLMHRALAIDERSLGFDHSNVARDLNNLAQLLQATNRLTEAEPLMYRALAIDERNLGSDHPTVAIGLNNLAQLLQASNRLTEAELLSKRMVEIFLRFTQATGHPHPHLHAAINNYAGLLRAMGRSPQEVLFQLNALGTPYGLSFGNPE